MQINIGDVSNNYKVNRFLRKFAIHIVIVTGLTILLFFNKPLAGIGFIIWGAVTVFFYLNW